jgi:ABC-type Na+ transport system ATPase subunit NatA
VKDLDGADLEVESGEILRPFGPNGAKKTIGLRILAVVAAATLVLYRGIGGKWGRAPFTE